jgi:hypothetical protein
VQLQQQKHQKRPTKGMVIVTNYELVEKQENGVFY